MTDINFMKVIDRMNGLIRRAATGTPSQFAYRLNISESTLYNYLNILKYELNAPIAYCRYRKTYFYRIKGNVVLSFTTMDQIEIARVIPH